MDIKEERFGFTILLEINFEFAVMQASVNERNHLSVSELIHRHILYNICFFATYHV